MSTLRKALVVLLLGCLLLVSVPLGADQSSSAATLSADAPTARGGVAANQVLLGFRPGLSAQERNASIAQRGGRLLQWFASSNVALITLPTAGMGANALNAFAVDDAVLFAEPNARIYPARMPDDTRYRAGELSGLSRIAAPEAWETTTGSPNLADGTSKVVVGVVDSGVDYTHPDLAANIWSAPTGWNLNGCPAGSHGYRSDPSGTNCDPIDEFYHGTHVAGIIGAVGNNDVGVVGVNWQTSIMALRVFDASGNGDTVGAVAAIDYAVRAKAQGVNLRVLNISWTTPTYSRALYDQIIAAGNQNILVVTAAGNDGKDNTTQAVYPANFGTHVATDLFPAAAQNVLTVAATDSSDSLATYNVGTTPYSSNYSGTRVHLGAPGKDILSTFPGDDYGYLSGTSMATPFVAGAAALLLSALIPATAAPTDLTATELRDRLSDCGDPIMALSSKTISGKRLNVTHAINGTGGCATPAPSYALTLDQRLGGTATASPAPGNYPFGTQIELNAVPASGYSFAGWMINGEPAEPNNPYPLGIHGPRQVLPVFLPETAPPQQLALTPAVAGVGEGPLTLILDGENFLPGVTVLWHDSRNVDQPLTVRFISTTRLELTVPVTLLAAPTVAQLTVTNPALSPSPSPSPSATPSPSPSDIPSPSPSATPEPSPSSTPSPSPNTTPSPSPTPLPTPSPSPSGASAQVEFTVLPSQQITFERPADRAYVDGPFTIDPTLSPSGLPLTYTTNGICTATPATVGATIAIVKAGRCAITVTQGGDSTHAPATPVAQDFFVDKGSQTITFAPLQNRTYGAAPFSLTATASSGLAVSFSVPSDAACTLNGVTITLIRAGTCTVTARQSGDGNYYAAQDVLRPFTIIAPSPSPTPSPTPSTLLPSPSTSTTPTPAPVKTTYTLTKNANGLGTVAADPPAVSLDAGTVVTLTASPLPGYTFVGWFVDGVLRSYANPVRLTMNSNHTVVAQFVAQQFFNDVPAGSSAAEAINALAVRGVIRGCDATAGLFCPDETTLRAQMAALITRAMGWTTCESVNPFPDQNGVDNELWCSVGTLANYDVARGYQDASGGKYFDPTGNVLAGQTISFITRAMIKKGYWQSQPDAGAYPNVPTSSGHREDIATYLFYVKSLPDFPNTSGDFTTWNQPSTRAWFARTLWAALQSHFNVETLP